MTWTASSNNSAERTRALIAIELEQRRRRRERQAALRALPAGDFLARTKIEVPTGTIDSALAPFALWQSQHEVLAQLEAERLILFLKARQLGISWLVCGFVFRDCTLHDGRPWLMFSQGQLEANELTRRIGVLYRNHENLADLPKLVKDNTGELAWDNGGRIISLPATKKAGRSFTAAGVVLDEFAFMLYGREVLAAVKPTIDAGGKLIIISSADGNGTPYHQFWQAARGGASGYRAIFLPWTARPDRGPGWREQKIREANGDTASVLREYPENDIEAFTHAIGLVYADQWADGPEDGNVTEAADYQADAGSVLWAVDDGYAGKFDASTGMYTATSHPRVILFVQERADGSLNIFDELYAIHQLSEDHIADALARPYDAPDWAVVDKSAAELKGRLHEGSIPTRNGPASVEESIKETRRALAADANGWRRIRVHPRCTQLRKELASYRLGDDGVPIKAFDHGPDCLRYLAWVTRNT
jgi:hypothetical protein